MTRRLSLHDKLARVKDPLIPAEAQLFESAATRFEKPVRRWPRPGDLAKILDPETVQTPALEVIDDALVELTDRFIDRLMIFMPPQEGKSVRVCQRYVEWLLTQYPDLRVAIVSNSEDLARGWGAEIKRDLENNDGTDGTLDLGLRLRDDTRAAGRWRVEGRRGGVYCVSVGGSLTGRPVDVLILDDPIKDLEQAQSATYRERAWRFWQGVAIPRLGPQSRVVLVQTRWHEDDLAGRLLASANADRWRVVSIPAIAETTDDALGRKPGEVMVSARGDRDWAERRADVGEYVWAALFQQRPAPAAGGIFKRADARYWRPAGPNRFALEGLPSEVDLRDCMRFITIDLATSTRTSADFTVAAAWAIAPSGDLILLDRVRDRVDKTAHWDLVTPLRQRWLTVGDTVHVEAAMFGTTFVYEAGRQGIPIRELVADKDKLTRALPAAARWKQHRVWLPPDADWLPEWLEELAAFPNAVHDDQVDVFAYAARVAATEWIADEPGDVVQLRRAAMGRNDVLDIERFSY